MKDKTIQGTKIFLVLSLTYLLSVLIFNCFVYHRIQLDDTDKQNLVQLMVLAGAIIAIIDAFELRKNDLMPVLALEIANSSDSLELESAFCTENKNKGKILKLYNYGKGTAFNLTPNRAILDSESKEITDGMTFTGRIISPGKFTLIKLTRHFDNYEDLNNYQLFVETESITKDKTFWRFIVRDAIKHNVELVKYTNKENEIMNSNG